MSNILVTSAFGPAAPFDGIWETEFTGYTSALAPVPNLGSCAPPTVLGVAISAIGYSDHIGAQTIMMLAPPGTSQTFFDSLTITKTGGTTHVYPLSAATFASLDQTGIPGGNIPTWTWPVTSNLDFAPGIVTVISFAGPPAPNVLGNGDITDPGAWTDPEGNIPPKAFQNVPQNVSYPLNGDGRYWFSVNATTPTSDTISFIGDTDYYTGSASLQWSITQIPTDTSGLVLSYSQDGGAIFTDTQIGPSLQHHGLLSGEIIVDLTSISGLQVKVSALNGSPNSGPRWQVAVAITRNITEGLTWDSPNPFDPINYNASILDVGGYPMQTLSDLRTRILIGLGFANQATNPPPGMAAFVNDKLLGAQNYLYRRYPALHTRRFFRWKVNPGQRFYSLMDNDEDVIAGYHMDPAKTIEWAGIQDSRNVWYPLIEGIPPQLYTMIAKPWRPARYDIRQAIELYPAPDQTYWLWIRANFGLLSFVNDGDVSTIDSELVYLHALALAKGHYGQPDANNVEALANAYRGELIAGTHKTAHYVPGTVAIPPAVRPTLIQYQDNQGG